MAKDRSRPDYRGARGAAPLRSPACLPTLLAPAPRVQCLGYWCRTADCVGHNEARFSTCQGTFWQLMGLREGSMLSCAPAGKDTVSKREAADVFVRRESYCS